MTEEQYLYLEINLLKLQYEALVKPYVDRLVRINSMRVTPNFLVNVEDLTPEMRERLAR